ncbi:MAG: hypothetical protein M3Q44_06975 [bacterium]|nr:hypothetical protein [bacterium]
MNWSQFLKALLFAVLCIVLAFFPESNIGWLAIWNAAIIGFMQLVWAGLRWIAWDFEARKWLAVGIAYFVPPFAIMILCLPELSGYGWIVALVALSVEIFALVFILKR